MKSDPTIEEVRRIRRVISAEYGNEPSRMLDYFADIQARVKDRLVNYGEPNLLIQGSRATGSVAGKDESSSPSPQRSGCAADKRGGRTTASSGPG